MKNLRDKSAHLVAWARCSFGIVDFLCSLSMCNVLAGNEMKKTNLFHSSASSQTASSLHRAQLKYSSPFPAYYLAQERQGSSSGKSYLDHAFSLSWWEKHGGPEQLIAWLTGGRPEQRQGRTSPLKTHLPLSSEQDSPSTVPASGREIQKGGNPQ